MSSNVFIYEYCLNKNHIIFLSVACDFHPFFTFLRYFLNFDVFNIFLLLKSVYIECSCIFVMISDQTRLPKSPLIVIKL